MVVAALVNALTRVSVRYNDTAYARLLFGRTIVAATLAAWCTVIIGSFVFKPHRPTTMVLGGSVGSKTAAHF